jgi:hypothetical protein
MINSFHRDEKTVFLDFVILMSDNTMKESLIRITGFAFFRHDSAQRGASSSQCRSSPSFGALVRKKRLYACIFPQYVVSSHGKSQDMKRSKRCFLLKTALLLVVAAATGGLNASASPAPLQADSLSSDVLTSDSIWLWPLAGYEAGEGILSQPGQKIGRMKNKTSLFLTAPEGTPVLCPADATVMFTSIAYYFPFSFPITKVTGVLFKDSTYEERVHEFDERVATGEIDPKYLTVCVSLNIGSRTVHLSGFMRERGLPEGTRLCRGDTLGTLHYGYCGFDEPNLWIAISRFNRDADPMTPFGILSTYTFKPPTSYQLLWRRILWVVVPMLVVGLGVFIIFRLRDRRRIAYFRKLKEEMIAAASPHPSPKGKGAQQERVPFNEKNATGHATPFPSGEGWGEAATCGLVDPKNAWADVYRQRIASGVRQYWTMPSAEYLHAAIEDETLSFSAEQGNAIVTDLRSAFHDIARDIRNASTKVNNDEVLYCLLTTLHLPTSVMARCLHVTDSTLRGRKTRLKAKMPEELYNVFFGKG